MLLCFTFAIFLGLLTDGQYGERNHPGEQEHQEDADQD